MKFVHMDVFTDTPFSGKNLTAVFTDNMVSSEALQLMAREFSSHMTVFVFPADSSGASRIRIFSSGGEQKHAGYAAMGAAAALHSAAVDSGKNKIINLILNEKAINIESEKRGNCFSVLMRQGFPEYIKIIKQRYLSDLLASINMKPDMLYEKYPVEIISAGIPSLLIPSSGNIDKAAVKSDYIFSLLETYKASRFCIFDINTLESRVWTSPEKAEIPASGSTAGALCAYLVKNRLKDAGEEITFRQGSLPKRKSSVRCTYDRIGNEIITGADISFFAEGSLSGESTLFLSRNSYSK